MSTPTRAASGRWWPGSPPAPRTEAAFQTGACPLPNPPPFTRGRESAARVGRARFRLISSADHPEAEVALALDLVDEFDLPFQVALARALAGIGVIGAAPAIVRRVGQRLAVLRQRETGCAPGLGAAVEHAHFGEIVRRKLGGGEPRQDAVG